MGQEPGFDGPFTILSEVERSTTSVRVLKDEDSFAVFDLHGDIVPAPGSQYGLYHGGTRFLSGFELRLGAASPLFLSSTVSDDNAVFTADLTNPDVRQGRPGAGGARPAASVPVPGDPMRRR